MLKKNDIVLVALSLFLVSTFSFAGQPVDRQGEKRAGIDKKIEGKSFAEGEILVKFKKGVPLSRVKQIAGEKGMRLKKHFRILSHRKGHVYVLLHSRGTTRGMLNRLRNHPAVASAAPNSLNRVCVAPNDPRYDELWGLHNTGQTGGTPDADIDAPEAWNVNTGSPGVVVAVLDSGVDYHHPDLAANMWQNAAEAGGTAGVDDDGNGYIDDIYGIDPAGIDGSTPDTDPRDRYGHGTHCSGTVAAVGNNGLGIVGVNWTAKVMALKMFDDTGHSGFDAFAIECIEYAIDQKVNRGQNVVAINASWGNYVYNQLLKDAIESAGDAGIVFCAAAGNDYLDNDTTPHYPASYDSLNILSVTATDHNDAQYYNYGLRSVDLGAPGRAILSTVPGMYSPAPGNIFYDDMESGAGQWTTGGTNNSWAISTDEEWVTWYGRELNGTNFWSDSPGADYLDSTDSWLAVTDDIDLSGYAGQYVYFGFSAAWALDAALSDDHGYIEISNDSGSNWALLGECPRDPGFFYFWNRFIFTIPEVYKTANFRFRFRLASDSIDNGYQWGWLIDEVGVGDSMTYDYRPWNGTSMAAPHVTGAVALVAAQYPAGTVSERIARILASVDAKASLEGITVSGGRLNLDKTLVPAAPTFIKVLLPTGGDTLYVGEEVHVHWAIYGPAINDVKLDYSTDGGGSWIPITPSTPNDGVYEWEVPDTLTADGKIRVSTLDDSAADESDGAFGIEYFSVSAGFTDEGYGVVQADDGGYLLLGYSDAFTNGGCDVLLYKLTASGDKQWRKNYGGIMDDYGFNLQKTADGGYLVGGYTYSYTHGDLGNADFLVYKLDAGGNVQWRTNLGGVENDYAFSVGETADGGYFAFGATYSFTNGGTDFLLYKMDGSGSEQWHKNFGGTGGDWGTAAVATADGGFLLYGETDSFTNGADDLLVYKLDANGTKKWRHNYGGAGADWVVDWLPGGNQAVQTADGGYVFCGMGDSYTNGSLDMLLYKVDAGGTVQKRKNFGGADWEDAYAVRQTADGGFVVAGYSESYTHGLGDFMVYKLDALGNMQKRKNFGGADEDVAFSIVQTADGGFAIAGKTLSYVNTPGYHDFLIYKLDANGKVEKRKNFGR